MAGAARSGKNGIDQQVEEFCSASAELLTSIHERCNNKGNGKKIQKKKRGRRKQEEAA
jgi:hypothetical protein